MLRVLDLEVVYHGIIGALRGIDVIVPEGKIVALLGANGAGKTTLIRSISGLLSIHEGKAIRGTIEWNNQKILGLNPTQIVRKGICQVMEGRRIFADLTVEENLAAASYHRKQSEAKNDLERYFELFPVLKKRYKSQAGYLSGGEQQMLAFARALLNQPRLLLLDEPSMGLAPIMVEEIGKLIKRINEEENLTILLVEQNAKLGLELSDYGYILENGVVAIEGQSEELLSNKDIQEFYLGMAGDKAKSFREVKRYRRKRTSVL